MDKEEKQALSQYKYIKRLADAISEAETKRESDLIQQSNQMQTAFSFITGAVFMAAPICIEYRGELPLKFFMISFSAITLFILISLVLASIAQWRWKTETFPDIDVLRSAVLESKDWEILSKEQGQLAQEVDLLARIQKEKSKLNDRRVGLIMASMIFFWISIGCVVVSFVIAIFFQFGR